MIETGTSVMDFERYFSGSQQNSENKIAPLIEEGLQEIKPQLDRSDFEYERPGYIQTLYEYLVSEEPILKQVILSVINRLIESFGFQNFFSFVILPPNEKKPFVNDLNKGMFTEFVAVSSGEIPQDVASAAFEESLSYAADHDVWKNLSVFQKIIVARKILFWLTETDFRNTPYDVAVTLKSA